MPAEDDIKPPCGHDLSKIRKQGVRPLANGEKLQKYQCAECGFVFSFGSHKKKLTYQIWKFIHEKEIEGATIRKISQLVMEQFNIKISHTGLWKWLRTNPKELESSPLQVKLLKYQNQQRHLKIQQLQTKLNMYKSRQERDAVKCLVILEHIKKLESEIKQTGLGVHSKDKQ